MVRLNAHCQTLLLFCAARGKSRTSALQVARAVLRVPRTEDTPLTLETRARSELRALPTHEQLAAGKPPTGLRQTKTAGLSFADRAVGRFLFFARTADRFSPGGLG